MRQKALSNWRTGLRWISPGLLLLLVLGVFIVGLVGRQTNWFEPTYIAVPAIILAMLMWFWPLVGGIIAILLAPFWYYQYVALTDFGDLSFVRIPLIILGVSGVISVIYYCFNRFTRVTMKS